MGIGGDGGALTPFPDVPFSGVLRRHLGLAFSGRHTRAIPDHSKAIKCKGT